MKCPHCQSVHTSERPERAAELGYRRFRCHGRRREFNERYRHPLLVEWRYRAVAAHALAGLLRDAAVVAREEHKQLIVDAFDRGILSQAERDDAILANIVVRGQSCDAGSPVLLVIEVAPELSVADVEQACHRAMLWAKFGLPAHPAVAGLTLTTEGARLAYDRQVRGLVAAGSDEPRDARTPLVCPPKTDHIGRNSGGERQPLSTRNRHSPVKKRGILSTS